MKKFLAIVFLAAAFSAGAQTLPSKVEIRVRMKDHVQGVAIDTAGRCFYLSFTTRLVKTDFEGNVLASIDTINGHLGAVTFDAVKRKLYASLECKDDEVGRNIAGHLGKEAFSRDESRFFVAVVDVDRLETDGSRALQTFEIDEVRRDYKTRYGTSGIDGITIAPQIGKKNGRPSLYLAYGIYSDTSRHDNDHQILLEFKPEQFRQGFTPKPSAKYFIYTGNTSWGVQNLCYDANTACIFMACYKGRKAEFPNFSLFAVPVAGKPVKKLLRGLEDDGRHSSLSLWNQGLRDTATGICGWRFPDATTGICTLGDGTWFVATPLVFSDKMQTATIRRLKWNGGGLESPFE